LRAGIKYRVIRSIPWRRAALIDKLKIERVEFSKKLIHEFNHGKEIFFLDETIFKPY
jgi:hypothetical protein